MSALECQAITRFKLIGLLDVYVDPAEIDSHSYLVHLAGPARAASPEARRRTACQNQSPAAEAQAMGNGSAFY